MPAAGDTSSQWARKRPIAKAPWPNGKSEVPVDGSRAASGRAPLTNGINGASAIHQQQQSMMMPQNQLIGQNGLGRPGVDAVGQGRQPVLHLLSLNGSFERKTISVPFYPDTLRIGRQTNAKTVPTPVNGYFDSKVLSRQHAEIWADTNGKIWIRDVKSSNGTFVNGTRLSPENRDSEPHELQTQDHLELGIDIVSEDQKTVVHHKVAAKVEHAGFITPTSNVLDMNFGDLDPAASGMMLPQGGATPFRGRAGSQPGVAGNGRMPPGNMGGPPNTIAQQRQFWLNPVTTEHIVKKLHVSRLPTRIIPIRRSYLPYHRPKCAMLGYRIRIWLGQASSSAPFYQRKISGTETNTKFLNHTKHTCRTETFRSGQMAARHGSLSPLLRRRHSRFRRSQTRPGLHPRSLR
jgi:hypothetical protein